MLGSFSTMLSKLKTTKIAQNITENYNKIKERIQKKIGVIEVVPNIYHIDFPDTDNCAALLEHIGDREFQIWNISEYKYDKQLQNKLLQSPEQGEIHHLCFQYYSNLPLCELIIALNSIHSFMALNPNNRVYLHCQDNKIRSGVFLACLLFKFHILKIQDLSEAILYINKKLSINLQVGNVGGGSTEKYKNLHVFFKNFINFLDNPSIINKKQLELLKIIVNEAPKLKISNQLLVRGASAKEFRVGLQIRCKQQIIFKSVYQNNVFEGDSLCLQLSKKTIILSDDFLVILKYIFKGKIYNIMRVQMNTNFIYQKFYRTHLQLIDVSAFCQISNPASMFIDFMFEENNACSNLSKLNEHASQEQKHPKTQQVPKQMIEGKQQETQETNKANLQSFSLHEHDQQDEEHHEVDQNEINRKIEEVIKNITKKQPQKESQSQEQGEQDLDDYLSKLQSQV